MFDLEKAIAEWRNRMLAAGIKTPVPLDELESHLRDGVEDQMKSGVSAQEAFEAAVLRIGEARLIKHEFTKVSDFRQVFRGKALGATVAAAFLICWFGFGQSPVVALVYSILIAGLMIAAFIDFKHFIIPDEITIGGIVVGFFCSLLLPQLHGQTPLVGSVLQSLIGIGVGAGLVYLVLRGGKFAFGRQTLLLSNDTRMTFTDAALVLPDKEILYDEIFYRKSDTIELQAQSAELGDRSYKNVAIRLSPTTLRIGADTFNPEAVRRLEAVSRQVILPREVMGFGDVKFMAAIGAFLGWQAVIFSLVASSCIGAIIGTGLVVAGRREWSSRLPYGPYIALAAMIWIFAGKKIVDVLFGA